MAAVAMRRMMAKKKGDTESSPPAASVSKRRQVDLGLHLFPKLEVVAAAFGMSVPAYINSRLEIALEADMPAVAKAIGLHPK